MCLNAAIFFLFLENIDPNKVSVQNESFIIHAAVGDVEWVPFFDQYCIEEKIDEHPNPAK